VKITDPFAVGTERSDGNDVLVANCRFCLHRGKEYTTPGILLCKYLREKIVWEVHYYEAC